MAQYAIGDVQGCWHTLQLLLRKIDFRPGRDALYLLGDLVGRGTASHAVLRFVYEARSAVHCVLGNHDLALLCFAAGIAVPRPSDRLDDLLRAEDAAVLLQHLRQQPLVAESTDFLLLHAGALPSWDRAEVLARGRRADAALQSQAGHGVLQRFWQRHSAGHGGDDSICSNEQAAVDQTVRVLTCLRTMDAKGAMDEDYKGPLSTLPPHLTPWFRWPNRALAGTPIACGHWAALGVHCENEVFALDAGCVWGGSLCAMRLSDRTRFVVPNSEPEGIRPQNAPPKAQRGAPQ